VEAAHPLPPVPAGLVFLDEDGEDLVLDESEAAALLTLTDGLDPATVSACTRCRSRVVAVVALVDLLESRPPHGRGAELTELAEEAPTLHLYVADPRSSCRHDTWRDPGFAEWLEVVPDELSGGYGSA
jgi:hypothetical protein